MRIGSATILVGREWREEQERQKQSAALIGKTSKQLEKELKTLREYESYQRKAFEAEWMILTARGATDRDMAERRRLLLEDIMNTSTYGSSPLFLREGQDGEGMHLRRLKAELWAIERLMNKERA